MLVQWRASELNGLIVFPYTALLGLDDMKREKQASESLSLEILWRNSKRDCIFFLFFCLRAQFAGDDFYIVLSHFFPPALIDALS